ncbi:MAG: hypothetical protein EOM08_01485 [Clostridia bacterium]|nr:hypothetical protein [Clostridia bacterium]NCC75088.1 hypothetical protein [Clostridia bacterium]
MIAQAIVLALSLVVMVSISLQGVLFAVPIFQRMTFDAICHRGLMQMDQSGGMTDDIQLFLENHLAQAGFQDILVHGDRSVTLGSEMSLFVQASLAVRSLTTGLQMTQESRAFVYHNSILSRHLVTAAGMP